MRFSAFWCVPAGRIFFLNGFRSDCAVPTLPHQVLNLDSFSLPFWVVVRLDVQIGNGVFTPLCEIRVSLSVHQICDTGQRIGEQVTPTVPLPLFVIIGQALISPAHPSPVLDGLRLSGIISAVRTQEP